MSGCFIEREREDPMCLAKERASEKVKAKGLKSMKGGNEGSFEQKTRHF